MEHPKDTHTIIDFFEAVDDKDLDTVEAIDSLIGKHKDSIARDKLSIKNTEKRIKHLESLKGQIKYGENSAVYEFADYLHEQDCMQTPTCTWAVSSWDDFHKDGRDAGISAHREIFFNKANRVMELAKKLNVPFHKAREIVKSII